MKKLFIATISVYLIIKLISSCAMRELYEDSLNEAIKDSAELNIPVRIEPFNLDIIPPSLGVQFYRNGIVFLSESKNEEKISSGHVSFGTAQAYYAPFGDSTLGQHINFSPKAPFPYPCEALSFSNDFGTMYFTKISEKDNREKIFRAENFMIGENKQVWTFSTEPVEFCKEGSIYSHPSISVDGNILIFSSDMPGFSGGMDLFFSRQENMKWSEPENLGKFINTAGNEIFPVLDRDNNLFFSSNGLPGFGGYDIFICKYNGKGWDIPVKITKFINTKNDEFAFTIDRNSGKSAFFTSRKTSKSAEPQLYKISFNKNLPDIDKKDLSEILYDMSVPEIDSSEIKLMAKKLEAEKMRSDSIEAARIEAEKINAAKTKSDSLEAAKLEAKRLEEERLRTAKTKADSLKVVKQMAERLKAERLQAEKMKADSITTAKIEAERLKTERLKAEKLKADSIAAIKLTAQKLEAERIKAANKRKADSLETERLKADRLKAEKLSVEKVKADSLTAARQAAEKLKAERLRVEKVKADSIEAARIAALKKESKDIIVYKVQILSTVKPKGNFDVTIDGAKYTAYQYFYLNEYRYVIAEFSSVDRARDLQFKARKSGWPQAFVAAFKNNVRSTDPALFK